MANESINYLIRFILDKRGVREATKAVTDLNKIIPKEFEKAQEVISKQFQVIGQRGTSQIGRFNIIFRDTNNQFRKLTGEMIKVDKGWQVLSKSIDITRLSQRDFNVTTTSTIDNLKRLAYRAALTIPIWYTLRRAIMSVITTITDGLRYWEQIDKELARVGMTLGDVSTKNEILNNVFDNASKIASQYGLSIDDLVKTFYRFKTIGLSIEESMAGMLASAKGSVAMLGDLDLVARALSSSYLLLGKTMTGATPDIKMLSSLGKLMILYRDNAFELNEMARAIERFLPTANTLNFTFDEMIAFLATLHSGFIKDSRAARLFRTMMINLVQNLDTVARVIDIKFNTELERTPDILFKVISTLSRLAKEGRLPLEQLSSILGTMVGGVRAQDVARALIALPQVLARNYKIFGMTAGQAIRALNEQLESNEDRLYLQRQRLRELRREIGQAFVVGITGADDFAQALDWINDRLQKMIDFVKAIGQSLPEILSGLTGAIIGFGLGGPAGAIGGTAIGSILGVGVGSLGEQLRDRARISKDIARDLNQLVNAFNRGIGNLEFNELYKLFNLISDESFRKKLFEILGPNAIILIRQIADEYSKTLKDTTIVLDKIKVDEKTSLEQRRQLTFEERRRLDLLKDELEYLQMALDGYNRIEISYQRAYNFLDDFVQKYNKSHLTQLETSELLLEAMRGNYAKIFEVIGKGEDAFRDIIKLQQLLNNVAQDYYNTLIKYSDQFKSTFRDAFADLLKGASSVDKFVQSLSDKIRDMFATSISEAFTSMIWKITGLGNIFGGIFAGIENIGTNIQIAGTYHANVVANAIIKASNAGARSYAEAISTGTFTPASNITIGGGFGGLRFATNVAGGFGLFGGLGNIFGFLNRPIVTGIPRLPIPVGLPGMGLANLARQSAPTPGPTWAQLLGLGMATALTGGALGPLGGLGTAMMGISQLAQAGLIRGTLGTWGTSWMGPVGIALSIASMFLAMGKTREQTQEQQRTMQIASRIDITNRNLEIINRNLLALRSDIRTFILPSSAYFAEKINLEDEFALSSTRGY